MLNNALLLHSITPCPMLTSLKDFKESFLKRESHLVTLQRKPGKVLVCFPPPTFHVASVVRSILKLYRCLSFSLTRSPGGCYPARRNGSHLAAEMETTAFLTSRTAKDGNLEGI
jgi:hypothetical protein